MFYVRKNAIYAIMSIYKYVDYLIPDAPELIESVLSQESDVTCQRPLSSSWAKLNRIALWISSIWLPIV